MEIRGLSALVTGGSGFIGGRLAERLATEEGVRVRAMVRNVKKAERLQKLPLEIVQADLLDLDSLRDAVSGCDLVFHCAALVRETGNRNEFFRTNVEGTENILKVSSEAGVKKFIHFSSVAVYGMNPPDRTDETTAYQPCGNLYCDTKIAAEKAVWAAHQEGRLPVVVIQPANVYGPHSNPWTLRPIKLINSGQMILINGGRGLCNYVYIDNLIDATLVATKRDPSVGQAYLVSDGNVVMWKEFFGYYAQMAGKPNIRSVPEGLARVIALSMEIASRITGRPPKITREAVRYLTRQARFSIEKARRELGYQPRFSLEDGMKLTEQWLREAGYLPNPRLTGEPNRVKL
ncbi:MAG: NAD-dependent epimerase/dehydratase family protein [Thermodesulfobacteriota bacterium]|nr:NAD-dependent epimerase/dehydratase family protein [Thermodesulfobacteriota bacterium]